MYIRREQGSRAGKQTVYDFIWRGIPMVAMAQNMEEFICYDEFWLSKDMGYFFEYCEDYCREIYNKNFN